MAEAHRPATVMFQVCYWTVQLASSTTDGHTTRMDAPSNHNYPMKYSASATRSTLASQKNKPVKNPTKKPSPAPAPPVSPKAPADDLRALAATPQRPSAGPIRKNLKQILPSVMTIHRLDPGRRNRSLRRGPTELRMRMMRRNRRL